MVFTLIIMVIILLVLTPIGIVVDKKIEAYFENIILLIPFIEDIGFLSIIGETDNE